MLSVRTAVLGALLLAPAALAQRLIVVDAGNRPGTHYLDVPQALAAAADGDTIVVRAHPQPAPFGYRTATTSLGVSIVGEPGARFTIFNSQPFTVSGLPTGRDFSMAGMEFTQSTGVHAMSFSNCAGRIHLAGMSVTASSAGFGASGIDLVGCSQATITDSTIIGAPAIYSSPSTIIPSTSTSISNSDVRGGSLATAAYPAIQGGGQLAYLSVNASRCRGGVRGSNGDAASPIVFGGDRLFISGDTASSLVEVAAASVYPRPAVNCTGPTSVFVDPSVRLVPRVGAPDIAHAAQVVRARLPSLVAVGASPGGIIRSTLYSPNSETVILIAGFPFDRVTVPPFGDLWFDVLAIHFVTASFQGPSEHWIVDLPIPSNAPQGMPVTFQGLSGPGLDVKLSNPVVVVLN